MENIQEVLYKRVMAAVPALSKIAGARLLPTETFVALTLALEPNGNMPNDLLFRHVARTLKVSEQEVERAVNELCAQGVVARRDFVVHRYTCQMLPMDQWNLR